MGRVKWFSKGSFYSPFFFFFFILFYFLFFFIFSSCGDQTGLFIFFFVLDFDLEWEAKENLI